MRRSTRACLWRSTCRRVFPRFLRFATAAVLVFAGAKCAGQLPVPGADQARLASGWWPDATAEQLALGRSLYIQRCAGCHALILPSRHPPQKWEAAVLKMAPSAKLNAKEIEAISRYLAVSSLETFSHPEKMK